MISVTLQEVGTPANNTNAIVPSRRMVQEIQHAGFPEFQGCFLETKWGKKPHAEVLYLGELPTWLMPGEGRVLLTLFDENNPYALGYYSSGSSSDSVSVLAVLSVTDVFPVLPAASASETVWLIRLGAHFTRSSANATNFTTSYPARELKLAGSAPHDDSGYRTYASLSGYTWDYFTNLLTSTLPARSPTHFGDDWSFLEWMNYQSCGLSAWTSGYSTSQAAFFMHPGYDDSTAGATTFSTQLAKYLSEGRLSGGTKFSVSTSNRYQAPASVVGLFPAEPNWESTHMSNSQEVKGLYSLTSTSGKPTGAAGGYASVFLHCPAVGPIDGSNDPDNKSDLQGYLNEWAGHFYDLWDVDPYSYVFQGLLPFTPSTKYSRLRYLWTEDISTTSVAYSPADFPYWDSLVLPSANLSHDGHTLIGGWLGAEEDRTPWMVAETSPQVIRVKADDTFSAGEFTGTTSAASFIAHPYGPSGNDWDEFGDLTSERTDVDIEVNINKTVPPTSIKDDEDYIVVRRSNGVYDLLSGSFEHTAGKLFPVRVWADGGSAGDASNSCSKTYTVRTLDATGPSTGGISLGTSMSPQKRRTSVGAVDFPAATGSGEIGLGYFVASTFYLYDANEVPDVSGCS